MPVNKEAFIRYRLIDLCLRNKRNPFPNSQDLMDVFEEKLGKTFSLRTIIGDVKAMKEDEALGYNAPIKFSRKEGGYHYTDPNFTIASVSLSDKDIQAIEFATSVLHQYKGVGIFSQFDDAVDKILNTISIKDIFKEAEIQNIIQLEKVPFFKGSEWLSLLLSAIKEHEVVSFVYQKYNSTQEKELLVHPYLLKEYRNRWYLIGLTDRKNLISTYGLDRISKLKITKDKFRYSHDFDHQIYFKHAYGITTFEGKPEVIHLTFNTSYGQYILNQPLHETQKTLIDDENEIRISLELGITPELIQDILGMGKNVKVLQPAVLVKQIQKNLSQTLGQYK